MGAPRATCSVCGCRNPPRFRFAATDGGAVLRCLRHALAYGPLLRRSARVAAIVGAVLFLINQADVVLAGHLTFGVAAKVALTFLVPFSVATYAALAASRLPDAARPPS